MAESLKYRVYEENNGEHVASFRYMGDALYFARGMNTGATVRLGHAPSAVLWKVRQEDLTPHVDLQPCIDVMVERERQLLGLA